MQDQYPMQPPKRCGAKTRAGGTCKNGAMPNGRCRMHGGKSLGGIGSPRYKTGRYSKYLPSRLADKYNESLSDPELLTLREDISLLDARVAELLEKLDAGESKYLWKSLRDRMDDFEKAQRYAGATKNEEVKKAKQLEAAEALSDIRTIIHKGASDWNMWTEIGTTLDQRRKLVDSERKRLVDMENMITTSDAISLARALAAAVKELVVDREVLSKINARFNELMHKND